MSDARYSQHIRLAFGSRVGLLSASAAMSSNWDGHRNYQGVAEQNAQAALVFTGLDGVDVTTPSLPAGFVLDVQATYLKAASTAQGVLVVW